MTAGGGGSETGLKRGGVGEWELRDTVTGFLFKCQKFNNSFNKEHANSAV